MECNSEDFNAVNRWTFAELAPSDLPRSLDCDLSDVDHAEFVRAKWMWTRKPKSFLEDNLSGYPGFPRSGSAFNPLWWNYPRIRLLLRDAPHGRQRCRSLRPLET